MTKEKNPQNQRTGISLFLGKRKPRASHIPTARLLLLHSLHRPAKQQNHDGATRYLPDLPTDSSEEAKREIEIFSTAHVLTLTSRFHRLPTDGRTHHMSIETSTLLSGPRPREPCSRTQPLRNDILGIVWGLGSVLVLSARGRP